MNCVERVLATFEGRPTDRVPLDLPIAHAALLRELRDVLSLEVPDPYRAFPMCEIPKATRILSREGAQVLEVDVESARRFGAA